MRKERRITLVFVPHLRRIHVEKTRVLAPTDRSRHTPDNIRYRVSSIDAVASIIVGLLAFFILSLHIGVVAIPLFLLYAVTSAYIWNRRTRQATEQMRTELPERTVLDIVVRGREECARLGAEVVELEGLGSGAVEVMCGLPKVCSEYYRGRVAVFAVLVLGIAVSLTVSYSFFPHTVPYLLLVLLATLLVVRRYPLCKRYSVAKQSWG